MIILYRLARYHSNEKYGLFLMDKNNSRTTQVPSDKEALIIASKYNLCFSLLLVD